MLNYGYTFQRFSVTSLLFSINKTGKLFYPEDIILILNINNGKSWDQITKLELYLIDRENKKSNIRHFTCKFYLL